MGAKVICKICKTRFEQQRNDKIYCSQSCRMKAAYQRRREELEMLRNRRGNGERIEVNINDL